MIKMCNKLSGEKNSNYSEIHTDNNFIIRYNKNEDDRLNDQYFIMQITSNSLDETILDEFKEGDYELLVLDLGCGNELWCLDMSTKYPWKILLDNYYNLLKPGGYLNIIESNLISSNMGVKTKIFSEWFKDWFDIEKEELEDILKTIKNELEEYKTYTYYYIAYKYKNRILEYIINMDSKNAASFQLEYSFMILFTGISLIINPNVFFNGLFMRIQTNILNIKFMPQDQELSNRHFGIVVCVFSIFYFISGWLNDKNFIKMSIFTRMFYGMITIIMTYYEIIPQQWLIAAIWDIITALITLILILDGSKNKKLNLN